MKRNLPAVVIAIWMSLSALACSHAQEIRLDGEVIDENGDPVVGASVTGFYLQGRSQRLQETTDADGKFSMDRRQVPTALLVHSKDRELAGVIVSRAKEEAITMEALPYISVTGRLIDGESGVPMADTDLVYQVEYKSGRSSTTCFHREDAKSDHEGFFRLNRLIVGGDAAVHQVLSRSVDGMALKFQRLKRFEVTQRDDFDLGNISIPVEGKQRTIEQRTSKLFGDAPLLPKFESAVELAEFSRRNILVVSGLSSDPRLLEFLRLCYMPRSNRDLLAFRILFADPTTGNGSKLRRSIGIDRSSNDLALDVFGGDGKLIETLHLKQMLDLEGRIDRGKVESFLSKHVIEPLDAKAILAEGMAVAKQDNKRILIQYSSSSQTECDQLTQFFDRNRIWEKDYVWLLIDTRWGQASAVLEGINDDRILDLPWFAILDSDGQKLTDSEADPRPNSQARERQNIGFPGKTFEKYHFKKMLMDTKNRLSEREIDELILSLDRN